VTTAAELDAEIKTYLDANQIFTQLKTAFSDGGGSTAVAALDIGKKRGSLHVIKEEDTLDKQRTKKINDLLSKVKQATSKAQPPTLSITAGPAGSAAPS
jgi:hypothetical protein